MLLRATENEVTASTGIHGIGGLEAKFLPVASKNE
jgi:hypothetical protein